MTSFCISFEILVEIENLYRLEINYCKKCYHAKETSVIAKQTGAILKTFGRRYSQC